MELMLFNDNVSCLSRWRVNEHLAPVEVMSTDENWSSQRKTCTSVTLSTTDPIWTGLGFEHGGPVVVLKVKLSLCFIEHHAVRACAERGRAPRILNINRNWRLNSVFTLFHVVAGETFWSCFGGGWTGRRTGLVVVVKGSLLLGPSVNGPRLSSLLSVN
jgi:hypothetical protein